ncbi:AAHS family benzoate transporter-like MFS transporter [Actinoplanes campanulatus]|uniref:AAHS family benzoate transporter-like MFS transporter n=1 Tax=Actinoplanes campanulatus TaxID=113559 RepID=A0A7W5AFB0_9ACTN|nr:aromatic acid/H+ symport family MFS transporter [Actinoplanes campanulatus]MBB3095178.1 AAHS family benzoate transporter-like MFS transporter [Actinoplanes campanulatus]
MQRTSPRSSKNLAGLVVAICWLVVLFDGVDLFIYGAVLPGMLEDPALGLTKAAAGTLGSYATFGMLLGALGSGPLTDRIGRKMMLIVSTTVFSIASGVCAAAPSLGVFGLGRFVAGLGLGGLLPIALTMVAEFAPAGRRNLLIGSLMTAHQAGGILAATLGLWLLDSFGWRSAFWIGVLPLFIAVPLVARFLPESLSFLIARGRADEARRVAADYGVELPAAAVIAEKGTVSLFRNGRWQPTLLFWCASFGGLLLVYGVNTWLPTMMRGEGYDLGSALAFLIVINLGGIAGMLVAGRVADRFGAVPVAAAWFALTAVGVHLLGVHMPLAVTYAVVFLAGVFLFSAQTMVYAAVTSRYDTASRATAVGSAAGIGRFGAVLGPWMGGQLMAAGNQGWGFTVFAASAVFATVFVLLAGLRSTEQPAAVEPALTH